MQDIWGAFFLKVALSWLSEMVDDEPYLACGEPMCRLAVALPLEGLDERLAPFDPGGEVVDGRMRGRGRREVQ
jgi:hypothetical protein